MITKSIIRLNLTLSLAGISSCALAMDTVDLGKNTGTVQNENQGNVEYHSQSMNINGDLHNVMVFNGNYNSVEDVTKYLGKANTNKVALKLENFESEDLRDILSRCQNVYLLVLKNIKGYSLGSDLLIDTLLSQINNLSNLIHLDLSGNNIHDAGASSLMQSDGFHQLKTLNLSDNYIGDGVLFFYPTIFPALTWLDLSNNNLGDYLLELLINEKIFDHIEYLNLSNNAIGNASVDILVADNHFPSLVRLNLSHNNISNTGANVLADSNVFQKLEALDLSNNSIQNGGATALKNSKSLSNIRELNLKGNPINDQNLLLELQQDHHERITLQSLAAPH